MPKIPIFSALRVVPRDRNFLDRTVGSRGEIYFDRSTNTLRLYDGQSQGGFTLAKSDLSNVSNAIFSEKATSAGIGSGGSGEINIAADDSTIRTIAAGNVVKFVGGDGISTASSVDDEITIVNTNNAFSTIAVAGQSTVVADTLADTLTLVAGSNITITTDSVTDSITISAGSVGGASDSFSTIAVAGQSNVVADSAADTLTLVAGTGISIITDASTDTVTITNTVSAGATVFTGLSDVTSASLTVDKIYLPAITMLAVTNNGASSYRFDQYGSVDDPTIYAINATTIAFNLQATGHPFLIQDNAGNNYNTGLVHISTSGIVTTGASAQGKDSGTLYWKIPDSISGNYRYQCSVHAAMVGTINIKNFGSI
jgi:hypothetical protein